MDTISGCSTTTHTPFKNDKHSFPLIVNFITGVNGQAGSFLAEKCLNDGEYVLGLIRRSSTPTTKNIDHILDNPNFELIEGDITDFGCMFNIISNYNPNRIYNTAAQSHVHTSFNQPGLTWDVTAKGVLNILECLRLINYNCHFIQFSSSEMFGSEIDGVETIYELGSKKPIRVGGYQDENTRMNPQSPYGIAKLAGYNLTRLYRDSYNIKASNAILYNYESERRGEKFVTKKICKYIGDVCNKRTTNKLQLGNLDAERDWSYCPDSMTAVRLMSKQFFADDFVIGTGETHSVKAFVEAAFETAGLHWEDYVEINNSLKRPSEVPYLRANPKKIKDTLQWESTVKFKDLVKIMVEYEIGQTKR